LKFLQLPYNDTTDDVLVSVYYGIPVIDEDVFEAINLLIATMVTLQPIIYNNIQININIIVMKQESKIKSRITKLSKKSKEDLIQIILTKDKESNKLNGKINQLDAESKRQIECINYYREEIKNVRNKALCDVNTYIDRLNLVIQERNKYMWITVGSVIINILLVTLGLSIL